MCKCTPFEKTGFVTSSEAGNHITVYNTFIRSNKSNVNSSQFHDWNKLILTICKHEVLRRRWGSSILENLSLTARSPIVWPPLMNSHSFMQTITKSRTISSWLLTWLNMYERMWINQKWSHTFELFAVTHLRSFVSVGLQVERQFQIASFSVGYAKKKNSIEIYPIKIVLSRSCSDI